MHVDSTSLTELGLVPDASGAWPLASWLDTTHSSAAYTALKHLIAAPLGDVEQIRARQALLVQLVPVRREIPWASLEKLAAQVERYLASNYVIVPSPLIERTVFRFEDNDIHLTVSVGVATLGSDSFDWGGFVKLAADHPYAATSGGHNLVHRERAGLPSYKEPDANLSRTGVPR